MIENLEKVIKTLIIPRHPEIIDFRVFARIGAFSTWYIIDYTINVDDYLFEIKLKETSRVLFKMLAPTNREAVRVWLTSERNFVSND